MHPSLEDRFDEPGVPPQKTNTVQAGLCGHSERPEPAGPVRYQVCGGSVGMYQIKDRTTDKTCAFRDGYKAAHELAMQFEAKANRQNAAMI